MKQPEPSNAEDNASKDVLSGQVRRQWDPKGKTQLISALQQAQISENTMSTLSPNSPTSNTGKTIVLDKKSPTTPESKPEKSVRPGDTFTLSSDILPSNQVVNKGRSKIGETVTLSSDVPASGTSIDDKTSGSFKNSSAFGATVIKQSDKDKKEKTELENVKDSSEGNNRPTKGAIPSRESTVDSETDKISVKENVEVSSKEAVSPGTRKVEEDSNRQKVPENPRGGNLNTDTKIAWEEKGMLLDGYILCISLIKVISAPCFLDVRSLN